MIGTTQKIKPPMWAPGCNLHELWRGCIGYWPMWEQAGNIAYDLSGWRFNGILTGGPSWKVNEFGRAILKDSTVQYTDHGFYSALYGVQALTCLLTFKRLVSTTWARLVSDWSATESYRVILIDTTGTGGKLTFHIGRGVEYTLNTAISATDTGITHTVVGTWDGLTMRFYQDGVQDPSTTATTPGVLNTGAQTFRLGADQTGVNGPQCELTLGALWNRALSLREISVLSADPFCMIRQPTFDWIYAGAISRVVAGQPTLKRWGGIPHARQFSGVRRW